LGKGLLPIKRLGSGWFPVLGNEQSPQKTKTDWKETTKARKLGRGQSFLDPTRKDFNEKKNNFEGKGPIFRKEGGLTGTVPVWGKRVFGRRDGGQKRAHRGAGLLERREKRP